MCDLDFYKGKKIFITGHSGFKGSWMCQALLMAGGEVTGYSLEPGSGAIPDLEAGRPGKFPVGRYQGPGWAC